MRNARALFSAKSIHHCTPAEVVARVRQLGGKAGIGLDPCSNPQSIVGAHVEWRRGGLHRSWQGYGLVYCNPPYGRRVERWTAHCVETAVRGEDVVGLLPVRTDTAWWQADVARAVGVCFLRGRLRFLGQRSVAPFPSALIFWGGTALARAARAVCADAGWMP